MTFHFRCLNGDLVTTEAATEDNARAQAMEQRWGRAELNRTWAATHWVGWGLQRVGSDGLPVKDMA
jgi:hypothetical protein